MNQPYPGNQWQHLPPQPQYGQPYTPGFYPPPPPPPKKRKTGLWVLLALLAVIVVVGGGVVAFKLYVNRDWTATFEVTGTGTTATVRYTASGRGPFAREEGVALPWARDITFSGSEKAFVLDAFPTAEDDAVTCSVTVNGKVVVEKTAAPGEQAVCIGVNPDASRFG
ncbi:hypothetical protein KL953_17115 [Mycolicibacterium goodii]|uniref:MmpS family transport accessory protein n=1 Tax=Mycolicibacterium goodii TaxID=134601 RepID=UPI000C26172E|nr:MmpS family transport accessory protein [Mycolicibacterium goodii]MBU8810603.1 hypothetical protein [Mycolicibacterium goodii]PJK22319.1 hypothetical protein CSX11_10575 [Mycolicibacterium goodii]